MDDDRFFKLSRWCKILTRGESSALFHSLSLAVLFVPKKTGEYLAGLRDSRISRAEISANLDEEGIEALIREKLLIDYQSDEMEELRALRDKLLRNIHLEIMYLIMADGCNLRCRYCFEDAPCSKDFKAMLLDEATAHRAIELFARLTRKYGKEGAEKSIHFYGGEPLLNFKVVQSSVLKIESMIKTGAMPKECRPVIITNGLLLTEQMARFFADHGVTVGLSLDGPKHLNDVHRIAKNIETSVFDSAVRAYSLVKKYGAPLGLSVTLTPEVVDNFDEVLDFFINDLGIKDGIGFNIMHYHPAMPVGGRYFTSAANCLIKAFDRFRNLGIYEERMMRKAEAFANREAMYADCGVIGNQIVVAPDGLIGSCHDFIKPRKYFGKTVFDLDYDPVRDGLFGGWRTRSPMFMEQCSDCEAVGICGGGCPASAELKTGSRWNVDERICPHSKLSLEWLIWQTYDSMVSDD